MKKFAIVSLIVTLVFVIVIVTSLSIGIVAVLPRNQEGFLNDNGSTPKVVEIDNDLTYRNDDR